MAVYEIRLIILYIWWSNCGFLQIALGSKRGDNYTSMLYRIQLYGDDGWSKSLFYKCLPDNRQARNTYKSELLFNNEVTFYTKSYTALMAYQVRIQSTFTFNINLCHKAYTNALGAQKIG